MLSTCCSSLNLFVKISRWCNFSLNLFGPAPFGHDIICTANHFGGKHQWLNTYSLKCVVLLSGGISSSEVIWCKNVLARLSKRSPADLSKTSRSVMKWPFYVRFPDSKRTTKWILKRERGRERDCFYLFIYLFLFYIWLLPYCINILLLIVSFFIDSKQTLMTSMPFCQSAILFFLFVYLCYSI